MFRKKLLCYSLMGRKVFYFECYKSNEKLKSTTVKNKKMIVLTARVHPSESCSSIVLKSIIDEYLDMENTKESQFLRDNFFFIIIPMLNPDGVSAGNSRCSFSGNDLNLHWSMPDRFIHPEIYYTKKLLTLYKKNNEILFFMDIHGSSRKKGVFIFGNHMDNNKRSTREYPIVLANSMDDFELSACRYYYSDTDL